MNTSTNIRGVEPFTVSDERGVRSTNWRVRRVAIDAAEVLAVAEPGKQFTVRDKTGLIVHTTRDRRPVPVEAALENA